MKIKIGYLAPEGTFSHEAAVKWGGDDVELVGLYSFKDLIEALIAGKVDEVVVPVENMLFGGVGQCIDSIIAANGNLKIRGELVLEIRQNLIGRINMSLGDITHIVSIGEATGQCTEWIAKNLPQARLEYVGSTATAIRNLEEYGSGAVAIGSAFGAKFYGREILVEDIHDREGNATHFLILGKSEVERIKDKEYKTSIIFTVMDHPGALNRVLNVFDAMNINMVKIESRPSRDKLHDYIFWVDINGHRSDGRLGEALGVIAESKTRFLKVLGSYPKY